MPRGADDEQALSEDVIALAKQYGRYGYRRVTALLCHAGWTVNHKRVEPLDGGKSRSASVTSRPSIGAEGSVVRWT